MIKKHGRSLIIRRSIIKTSFSDSTLLDDKIYDEEITKIIIKSDFDYADDDLGPHFAEYPNLKEFKLGIRNSCYEVHDGLLYLRLDEESFSKKNFGYNCQYYDYRNDVHTQIKEGLLLVCCPRAINNKDVILHKDCTAIYGSAFEGCNLNSLTIPIAFRYGCPAAFSNLTVKTVYVPNTSSVVLDPTHNNVNKDVIVECIDGECETREWWKSGLNNIYE